MSHKFLNLFSLFLITLVSLEAVATENVNRPAPNCTLSNLEVSDKYDLQRFKGQVVYVDFWASWCGPCVQSFPYMNTLNRDLKEQGLQVLGVNLDENAEDAKNFVSHTPPQFLVATDTNGTCAKEFGVKAMPSTFLVDRKGMIREIHYGFRPGEANEFRSKVEQLLAEPIN
ncbi:TlpA disulfide reductase family protein [Methylomonas sp. AM2-LC]|uniref:TlpA family protein disulfide reductase n=1 Tax=Methylomonas sp. AM2-LC TaxID=3153301 RepID=UPI0032653496